MEQVIDQKGALCHMKWYLTTYIFIITHVFHL